MCDCLNWQENRISTKDFTFVRQLKTNQIKVLEHKRRVQLNIWFQTARKKKTWLIVMWCWEVIHYLWRAWLEVSWREEINWLRTWEAHIMHTCCVHKPPARLCETNSLSSISGARSTLRRGAHCAALPRQWGHMGSRRSSCLPFQRTTNSTAYYVWQRSLWGDCF